MMITGVFWVWFFSKCSNKNHITATLLLHPSLKNPQAMEACPVHLLPHDVAERQLEPAVHGRVSSRSSPSPMQS